MFTDTSRCSTGCCRKARPDAAVAVVERERPKAVQAATEQAHPGAAPADAFSIGQARPGAAAIAVDVKRVQVQHRLL
jgi:hypothetical protein